MLHRGLAFVAALLLLPATLAARRAPDLALRRLGHSVAGLFCLQAGIGIAQVMFQMPPALRLAHLALGAATWAAVIGALARALPSDAVGPRPAPTGPVLTAQSAQETA
jgi:heme A synthase